jgi:5-hydroxyisourate hydrolase-like protein (transthyretin family)
LKTVLPAPAAAKESGGATKKSVAEMMAEQNRRHDSYMSMSNAMMNTYKINFNTQANFSGSAYRYW